MIEFLQALVGFVISVGLALSGVGLVRENASADSEASNENVAMVQLNIETARSSFSASVSADRNPIETCRKVKSRAKFQIRFFNSAS
ncbi:MAG: hypothetical protein AAB680_05620 [Pseudomonadota bacterium]